MCRVHRQHYYTHLNCTGKDKTGAPSVASSDKRQLGFLQITARCDVGLTCTTAILAVLSVIVNHGVMWLSGTGLEPITDYDRC